MRLRVDIQEHECFAGQDRRIRHRKRVSIGQPKKQLLREEGSGQMARQRSENSWSGLRLHKCYSHGVAVRGCRIEESINPLIEVSGKGSASHDVAPFLASPDE